MDHNVDDLHHHPYPKIVIISGANFLQYLTRNRSSSNERTLLIYINNKVTRSPPPLQSHSEQMMRDITDRARTSQHEGQMDGKNI